MNRIPVAMAHTVEELEINLLLEAVYQLFDFDFRGHQPASIRTKLLDFMAEKRIRTVSALQEQVIHDMQVAKALLRKLSYSQVSLFFEVDSFLCIRELIEPVLRSYVHPKVWIPECTSPEEVFSLAILLEEAGVLERTIIHATCSNLDLLSQVKAGRFDLAHLEEYEANYTLAGGTSIFSKYWKKQRNHGVFNSELARNITWSQYNLATDNSFNEFHLIACRNRIGEYGGELRQRVLSLFADSLARFGLLFTDPVLELDQLPSSQNFHALSRRHGIYRRTYQIQSRASDVQHAYI